MTVILWVAGGVVLELAAITIVFVSLARLVTGVAK
jgi:hypothetical protein